MFYIQDVMGRDWWVSETAKPQGERHPLLDWRVHFYEANKALPPEPDGLVAADPDGKMAAYVLLAYDLYVLRDHGKLQDQVVQRLMQRDQFQGARYELFVAATFVRAGLEFAYEDETDQSKKHPEFIATHAPSGVVMAVEAKARQRMMKGSVDVAEIRPPVRALLLNALEKQPTHPLVVFLELNLPPEDVQPPSWVPQVNQIVDEIAAERGRSPFGAVFFTNRPHLYGLPAQADPSKHIYAIWPPGSPIDEHMIEILGNAAGQYGNVPSKFPDEFGASAI